jgi:hypothetical protein
MVPPDPWEAQNQKKFREQQEIEREFERLVQKYDSLIRTFCEIAESKVSLLDDYGDENWDVLPREVDIVIRKIAKQEGHSTDDIKGWKKYSWKIPPAYECLRTHLAKSFQQYHSHIKASFSPAGTNTSEMTGREFETYVSRVLSHNGFVEIRGTPVTGDQGADLIAKKDGKTIIVQAKRYEGPVSNAAVQEVTSAVMFYRGDEGYVITNSTFTTSARQLAQRTGIKLIDGRELSRLASNMK